MPDVVEPVVEHVLVHPGVLGDPEEHDQPGAVDALGFCDPAFRRLGAPQNGEGTFQQLAGCRRLVAAEVALGRASAQAGSAVLLAGLNAGGSTVVRYPQQVRDRQIHKG